jgi:hypothetical protein
MALVMSKYTAGWEGYLILFSDDVANIVYIRFGNELVNLSYHLIAERLDDRVLPCTVLLGNRRTGTPKWVAELIWPESLNEKAQNNMLV